MRQVIRIGEEPKTEKVLKPIELNYLINSELGWHKPHPESLSNISKVVFLGTDYIDGDTFAVYYSDCGAINIFKGSLNDGVY